MIVKAVAEAGEVLGKLLLLQLGENLYEEVQPLESVLTCFEVTSDWPVVVDAEAFATWLEFEFLVEVMQAVQRVVGEIHELIAEKAAEESCERRAERTAIEFVEECSVVKVGQSSVLMVVAGKQNGEKHWTRFACKVEDKNQMCR